jgi:uncharacterized protein (TIGR02145 family)
MKKLYFLTVFLLFFSSVLLAQVGINDDNSTPDNSAMLDVKSTSRGLLPPRMTTSQMNAIASPSAGLIVFNTTLKIIFSFNGTSWDAMTNGTGQGCGTISYGGQTYQTVVIGTQCWMAENLNIGTMINGSQEQANNAVVEKYCYDNNLANCDVYGGMYQWAEVIQYLNGATNTTSWNPLPTGDVQGICPPGWHLPADAEWTTLTTCLGGEGVAGGKMKEAGTSHWLSPNTGATNTSGFTALPGGDRYLTDGFYDLTFFTFFWSSSQYNFNSGTTAWGRSLQNVHQRVGSGGSEKIVGGSVRCLKN